MATTFSAITAVPKGSVFGDMRVQFGQVTINATGGSSQCGLKVVSFAMVTPQAITSGYAHIVTSGAVVIMSGTSADIFNVMAIGK
jgi:hypothetical protein